MSLFDNRLRFYFLFGSLVLVLGIVMILGFSYFKLQELFSSPTPKFDAAESRRLSGLAWTEVDKLKAEEATMPARPKPPAEECLFPPQERGVKTGIWKWSPVVSSEGIQEGFFDFHYSGDLKEFEEKNVNGCDYYRITLSKKADFFLNIPKGIPAVGSFSRLDPSFIGLHKDKNFQIRIRYFSNGGRDDLSSLKFVEWEIESLKVNQ